MTILLSKAGISRRIHIYDFELSNGNIWAISTLFLHFGIKTLFYTRKPARHFALKPLKTLDFEGPKKPLISIYSAMKFVFAEHPDTIVVPGFGLDEPDEPDAP